VSRPTVRAVGDSVEFVLTVSARVILGGFELMYVIKKRQMKCSGKTAPSALQQLYSLLSALLLSILHFFGLIPYCDRT
jgi:hypothetical protein